MKKLISVTRLSFARVSSEKSRSNSPKSMMSLQRPRVRPHVAGPLGRDRHRGAAALRRLRRVVGDAAEDVGPLDAHLLPHREVVLGELRGPAVEPEEVEALHVEDDGLDARRLAGADHAGGARLDRVDGLRRGDRQERRLRARARGAVHVQVAGLRAEQEVLSRNARPAVESPPLRMRPMQTPRSSAYSSISYARSASLLRAGEHGAALDGRRELRREGVDDARLRVGDAVAVEHRGRRRRDRRRARRAPCAWSWMVERR